MVLKLSMVPSLKSLKVLCSEDAEQDFFNNIMHLQVLSLSNSVHCSYIDEEIFFYSVFVCKNVVFQLFVGN